MQPWPLFSDPTAAPFPQPKPRDLGRPGPVEALARLRAGNHRFVIGGSRDHGGVGRVPFAVVVGCLDARVPLESIFGQDIGEMCVVRSAGHVLDQAVVASVEFAVTDLGVSLVVVLGHDDCRAIAAAVEAVRTGRRPAGARRYLVDQITAAVPPDRTGRYSLDQVTRSHVRRTVASLRQADHLKDAVRNGRLDVVGTIYQLSNGHVEVLSPHGAT